MANRDETSAQSPLNAYYQLGLDRRSDRIIEEAEAELRSLLRALDMIPASGSGEEPEGPSTEARHAELRRWETIVEKRLVQMREYAVATQEECSRCRRNLEQLGIDVSRLNLEPVRDKVGEAQTQQEMEYRRAEVQLRRITEWIAKALKALELAKKKEAQANPEGDAPPPEPRAALPIIHPADELIAGPPDLARGSEGRYRITITRTEQITIEGSGPLLGSELAGLLLLGPLQR